MFNRKKIAALEERISELEAMLELEAQRTAERLTNLERDEARFDRYLRGTKDGHVGLIEQGETYGTLINRLALPVRRAVCAAARRRSGGGEWLKRDWAMVSRVALLPGGG
jgi:hypothetical protein